MRFLLIQLIGLLGNLLIMAVMQTNNRRLTLIAQGVACILWTVHFWLLGAMTASLINLISFGRSVLFFFNDRKWAKSKFFLWLFIVLFIADSLLTWEGPRSLLPCIGMCSTTLALWTTSTKKMRLCYLCSSPPWLVYDLISGSYSCALMETIALISYIVAIFRFDRKRTAPSENTEEET